jgi:hypothetical protein
VFISVVGWNLDPSDFMRISVDEIISEMEKHLQENPGWTHVIYKGHDMSSIPVSDEIFRLVAASKKIYANMLLEIYLLGGSSSLHHSIPRA